jgi:methionyl-tRNA formyltransferase
MKRSVSFRSVFFGTPAFAVPSLLALHELTRVVGVVCQPDRRAGRGMKLREPPVKEAANALGVPVYQPVRVRDGELEAWLTELDVDVAVVAAYGRILPPHVLSAPKQGCVNLHASILPAYRGAAPIQWALMHGESETGISLMQMNEGLDTGAVYAVRRCTITTDMDSGRLTDELAALAADVVRNELMSVLDGRLVALPQDERLATYAPPITREHQVIDWSRASHEIVNQVRALAPVPGAFTLVGERRLKLLELGIGSTSDGRSPGLVLEAASGAVEVACGVGSVELRRVQAEGRTAQTGRDLLNGRFIQAGQRLGQPDGSMLAG